MEKHKENPEVTKRIVEDATKKFKADLRQDDMQLLMARVHEATKRVQHFCLKYFNKHIPTRDEFFTVCAQLYRDEFTKYSREELQIVTALIYSSIAYESVESGFYLDETFKP
jgi:predicted AlkP superfamily phosphohydrolase/phosphomutase